MSELTKADIRDAFSEALKSTGRSGSNFGGDSGGGGTDFFKSLLDPAKAVVQGAADIAQKSMNNTVNMGDVAKNVEGVLNSLGAPGKLAGAGLGFFAGIITETVDNWQKFSHEGLNFAGNAMAFREAVMRTGMSMQDFGDSLEKLKPAMFAFGGGIQGGMDAFGNMARTLNDPATRDALNTMGILPKEANEILAMTIRLGRANISSNTKQDMDKVVASAIQLATEMDAMSKLTGISRREQEKNIEAMENDARVRARLAILNANPEMQESIGKVQEAGKALPPEVAKVLMESVAGKGIITSEKLAEVQLTYGQRAANQLAEIGRLSTSNDKNERDRAAKMTEDLFSILAEDRKLNAEYVARGVNTSQMGLEAFTNNYFKNYDTTLARIKAENPNMSTEAAEKEAKQRAMALSQGKLIEDLPVMINGVKEIVKAQRDADGNFKTEDPRKMGTQIVVDQGNQLRVVGAELNKSMLDLNNAIPKFTLGADGFAKMSKETEDFIMQSKRVNVEGGNKISDYFVEFNKLITSNTTTLTDLPTKMASKLEEIFTKLGSQWGLKPKALGSKGTTGDWWESGPQGILMGEAGEKESVVPWSQRGSFIRDNLSSIGLGGAGMSSILKDIPAMVSSGTQNVEQAVAQMASTMPDSNLLAEKLDKISSIMASVDRHMKDAVDHANETAKNTREIGGIVA